MSIVITEKLLLPVRRDGQVINSGYTNLGGGIGGVPVGMIYPDAGIVLSTGSAWGTSITNNSANWNTAYTDRLKWDGGATGLTAATGRTSLGGTTVGQNIFTLTNPSAITFLRMNADNTISALSATDFKTALSLQNVTNESKATMFTSPTFTGTNTTISHSSTNQVGLFVNNTENSESIQVTAMGSSAFGVNDWKNSGFIEAGTNLVFDANAGALRFQTDRTTRMTILNTGNVGIGTTSPSYKFQVTGGEINFNNAGVDGADGYVAYFSNSAYPTTYKHRLVGSISSNTAYSFLRFDLCNGTSTGYNSILTLKANGNVGVNNLTPAHELDVTGTIVASGDIIAYHS